MVAFTIHLRVTVKRLTRYKPKVILPAMLEGKCMPFNMVANTNHTTLLKNQSVVKCLKCVSWQISNCKIIFMCSVNFWHQQHSNSLFKGNIGHMTSLCKWPIRRRRVQNSLWPLAGFVHGRSEFKFLATLVNNQLVCLQPFGILRPFKFDLDYLFQAFAQPH